MAKGDRNRDELRRDRVEAEETEKKGGRNRLILGYGVAAAVVVAIVVAVIVVVSGGGSDSSASGGNSDSGGAHINLNLSYGSTNGITPDERAGTKPPPVKVADLATAAKQAGCDLRLHLKDEGHEHIPPTAQTPDYKTNPPTAGPHAEAP